MTLLVRIVGDLSTYNTPDKARVYRATIAPLGQPAAALLDVTVNQQNIFVTY